jgi:putative transposase
VLAPDRLTSWKSFRAAHGAQIAATDFVTIEVWTLRGLKSFNVLFMIHRDTRCVHPAEVNQLPHDRLVGFAAERDPQ